jgi:hypothetical protein
MNDYYVPGGVQLRKAVYVLKCPVCGAELKSDQSGECPYCGAYLDVVNTAPPQGTIPMQTYGAAPVYPQQPAAGFVMTPQEADGRIRSWKKKQVILIAAYCILAAISVFGISFLNEGDTGYDLVMTLTALGYLPLSLAMPIYLPGTRPDECYKALGYPKPPHKALSWLIYALAELGLTIAMFVIVVLIQG